MMGFILHDPQSVLSKSQKEKIKAWFKENYNDTRHDYYEILERIHYPEESSSFRYSHVHVVVEEKDMVHVYLEHKTTPTGHRENLRERLRARLRLQHTGRTSFQQKGDDWKRYQQLLSSHAIRLIPVERIPMVLPDPDAVRKQRSVYEQFQKVCQDPTLQEYFALCLST